MGGNCPEVDRFDDDVGEGVVPGRRDLSLAGLAGGGGGARTLTVGDIDVGERDLQQSVQPASKSGGAPVQRSPQVADCGR